MASQLCVAQYCGRRRNGAFVGRFGGSGRSGASLRACEPERRFVAGRFAIERRLELTGRFVERAGALRHRAETDVRRRRARIEGSSLHAGRARPRHQRHVMRRLVLEPERAAEARLRLREPGVELDAPA